VLSDIQCTTKPAPSTLPSYPDLAPQRRPLRKLVARSFWAVKRRVAFVKRSWSSAGSRADDRYEARRSLHTANLPLLTREGNDILAELRDTGVAVRTLELPTPALDSAHRFIEMLRSKQTDEPCAKTTSRELAWDPRIFTFGLSEELLDLAECHIGLPPRYLGVEVKREIVNPAAGHSHAAVRRWHLDHEDRRILKVVVYLSDVDSSSAPFAYIDLPTSAAVLRSGRHHRPARLEETVRARVPSHKRRQVIGPRMTAIYVDTGQVLHRVVAPVDAERYSVTFAYCSRSAQLIYPQLMLPASGLRELRDVLSARQWHALCCRRIGLAR
jgi:hypothetical protein